MPISLLCAARTRAGVIRVKRLRLGTIGTGVTHWIDAAVQFASEEELRLVTVLALFIVARGLSPSPLGLGVHIPYVREVHTRHVDARQIHLKEVRVA